LFKRQFVLFLFLLSSVSLGEPEYERGPVPEGGLLFHASFDQGPMADAGVGWREMHYSASYRHNPKHKFRFVDGRVGKAVDLRPGRGDVEYACFKMHGHLCGPVGTLAFWFRTDGPPPRMRLETQSNDFWVMIRLFDIGGKPGAGIDVSAVTRDYSRASLALENKGWGDDQWHHLAIVWDETQGMRGYMNGREAASTWGKGAFQRGYLSAGRLALANVEYDDFRVYDVALSAEAVQALAAGRDPNVPPSVSAVPAGHRLEALSWKEAPVTQFISLADATRIRRVDFTDARALRKSGWRAVDGRADSAWPLYYHSYTYLGGGNLHLRLAPGERFNFVRATGRINRSSLCEGSALNRPADAKVLLDFDGERFVRGYPVGSDCAAPAVSVYKSVGRDTLLTDHRMINDLALLDVSAGELSNRELRTFYPRATAPESVAGANRVRLIQWYRPEERRIVQAALRPPLAEQTISVPALAYTHLMTPPQQEDLPLDAVRLRLAADGWKAGNLLNVRVHDPFNLWRTLIDVDLRMERNGEMDVTLQFPPTILPKDTELWITLVSRNEGHLRAGSGSSLTLYGPPMEKACESYLAWQHRLLKDNFAIISEPRPWFNNATDDPLRVANGSYDAIARIMLNLHRRFPTDRWTLGYMAYTRPKTKFFGKLPMPDLPQDARAPRWALMQKDLFKQFLDFAHWWVDERGVPNGELGSGIGDDTDLVQDWTSPIMRYDPDGKLRNNLMALAETAWKRKIRNGLNTVPHSYRHSYEEGLNVTPLAALLDYGDPVLCERLLATARRYDEVYPLRDGKRYPVRGHISTDNIPKEIGRGGPGDTGRLWHAGTMLVWYNGCRSLTEMMAQFFDGFGDAWKPQHMDIPHLLWLQTGDERFKRSFWEQALKATDPTWVRLENRKLPPETPLEKVVPKWGIGTAAGTHLLGFGDYESLRYSYNAWHFSRDKSYLVPSMERLWKQNYYAMPLWTKTGQSGDRVSPHKNLIDYMLFGGIPSAREHIVPNFAVSYEGFSLEMAALVIDDTPELLRWIGYNFEPRPQSGKLRVWRLVPGVYDVRIGPDANDDDRIDGQAQVRRAPLKRYEPIPITVPSRVPTLLEAKLIERDVPLHERCDLAVTGRDASREQGKLTVMAHNLGRVPTGPFEAILRDAQGREAGRQAHAGLDGIEDLRDKKVAFTFEGIPAGDLKVVLAGTRKEITEANNMARIGGQEGRARKDL